MAYTLTRCEKFSNGTTVYLAGEDDTISLVETQKSYNSGDKYFSHISKVMKKLLSFKVTTIKVTDFRCEWDEGSRKIKYEGGKNICALYYESPDQNDNIFRLYCLWPVEGNKNILIVGGGGLKLKDGPFQNIPELKQANSKIESLETFITAGIKSGKIIIKENKLISNTESLIIN